VDSLPNRAPTVADCGRPCPRFRRSVVQLGAVARRASWRRSTESNRSETCSGTALMALRLRDYDPFVLDSVYKDAEQVFQFKPRPLEESAKTGIVVLDTNALLVPYGTGKQSLTAIKKNYSELAQKARLDVPAQVRERVREVALGKAENTVPAGLAEIDHRRSPKTVVPSFGNVCGL